ncbi:MAG: hypothetical protein ACP5NS_02185 [Candidatus Pacearchaeota archaeon]
MNKRGFEIAMSAIVIIIISLVVLVALILFVRNGFSLFNDTTSVVLDASSSAAVNEACLISCRAEDDIAFCCTKYKFGSKDIFCSDKNLGLECSVDCSAVSCLSDNP